jgi:hypothetical protein
MRKSREFRHAAGCEQRKAKRYSLDLELDYKVFLRGKTVDSGAGRTIDCSHAGLRFSGERVIQAGRTLEVAIHWPVTLDDGMPINLVILGKSVRASERETAVRIVKHEFRTRAQRPKDAIPIEVAHGEPPLDLNRQSIWELTQPSLHSSL